MLVLVPMVRRSSGLYGEVSQIIRKSGPPTGDPVVQVAYKKSSLNAKGELLYLTVCDDDHHHRHHHCHYENNNNTIPIITVWSNNNLNGK
jgi:hypothetical protein